MAICFVGYLGSIYTGSSSLFGTAISAALYSAHANLF